MDKDTRTEMKWEKPVLNDLDVTKHTNAKNYTHSFETSDYSNPS